MFDCVAVHTYVRTKYVHTKSNSNYICMHSKQKEQEQTDILPF